MDAVQEVLQISMNALSDVVILYRTLVADGGLPPGFETAFSSSGPGTGVSRTTAGQASTGDQQCRSGLSTKVASRAEGKTRQGC